MHAASLAFCKVYMPLMHRQLHHHGGIQIGCTPAAYVTLFAVYFKHGGNLFSQCFIDCAKSFGYIFMNG